MKKILLSLIISISGIINVYAQGTLVYTVNDSVITTNSTYLSDNNTYNTNYQSLSYNIASSSNISVGDKYYSVKTGKFAGWGDGDPGYNVIEISDGNNIIYTHKQGNGIITFNDSVTSYGKSLREFSTSDMFIPISLSSSSKALIFIGWPYGGNAPQLIIIGLTSSDVKLVFDLHMKIISIAKDDNNFSMILQSNIQETTDGVTWTPAITHTIWLEDGVLKFKDN